MNNTIEELIDAFEGKLVGDFSMKILVCEVVAKLPPGLIDLITEKVWFMSSFKDTWAYAFTGDDLKGMHLVFLSDDLLSQDTDQIKYTIAHELGHIVMNHRNSTLIKQSKHEIDHQEKEADEFVKKYFSSLSQPEPGSV